MARRSDLARIKSSFKHTLSSLRKLGFPANISTQVVTPHQSPMLPYLGQTSDSTLCHLQVQISSPEGRALTLEAEFGGQARVTLGVQCLPASKEIRGSVWHSWSWLQDAGMPRDVEVAPF